ncbi:MAG TPA: xanthine dehydrogenase accessory protein XdhC [Xanthobacteraceae bacterium]|nr:xanthine dehydrogenase accessory protein XdhC [Xanthobacteraceae bacterium]
MAKVWTRIRDTIERHGSAALLSVVGAAGSVPRETGARIVLQPDGGFFGSIGGGRLEYEAIAAARSTLAAGRGKAQFRDWPLGPNLGQCCGGLVKTLTETFDRNDLPTIGRLAEAELAGAFATRSRLDDDGRIARTIVAHDGANPHPGSTASFAAMPFHEQFGEVTTPVLLFGAGHVGRAVVLALAPLPFSVRWIDSRADQFPQHVPQNVATACTDAVERELADAPRDALVVVMTHAHPLDFDIVAQALQRGAFDFVGLIGSETKRARFVSWARQLGIPDRELDRLVCPLGITEIKGKEPAVIAASLAAQLLMVREQASVTQTSPATQPA